MTKQDLYDAIGQLDGAYCRQALQKPEKKQSAPGRLLRVTSAAAAAAVFAGIVGGTVWFAGSLHSESSLQTGDQLESETLELLEESDCAEQPIAYGELELHQCYDERNPEDAAWLETALNNQEPLLPIDRAPYIAKFMEPAGDAQAAEAKLAELNTLPYKSYVYHIMLNSVDYYSTAQGSMRVVVPNVPIAATDSFSSWYVDQHSGERDHSALTQSVDETDFQVDLRSQQFYEISSADHPDIKLPQVNERYIADGLMFLNGSQIPVGESQPHCIPDNARCYFGTDGMWKIMRREETVEQMAASAVLFPQELAFSIREFDTWEITDTPVYLDREAVGIQGDAFGEGFQGIVDLYTGILLYWEWDHADGCTETTAVTSLEIDTDIAVPLHESTEAISDGGVVPLHECWDEREHPEWIESARSNKEPIPPIDRTPYIAKFTEIADDQEAYIAELNSLEYKSYLYHIMINSVDYYKTAQGSVRLIMPDGSINYEDDFQADLTAEQCYEKRLIYTEGVNSPVVDETYIADGKRISCAESEVYDEREAEPLLPNCIPDNARCWRVTNDSCFFDRRSNPVNGLFANFVLLPEEFAMSDLWDFDKWEIVDTCRILNRDAVVIQGKGYGASYTAAIDLETGMLLRSETLFDDGVQTVEVTKLEVDTDIEVKQFDRNAYTVNE